MLQGKCRVIALMLDTASRPAVPVHTADEADARSLRS